MSISSTEQAARGKRTLSPFLATKAVFYAAILISIRRADHFQVYRVRHKDLPIENVTLLKKTIWYLKTPFTYNV